MIVFAASGVSGPLLTALSIIAAGGGGSLAYQVYNRIKRGKSEDEELISRISSQVVEGAHSLLEEYRIELEVAKRQITLYLDQVTELNRLLGQANERISRLERDLVEREGDRADLRQQLRDAVRRRDELHNEIESLRTRILELETALETHHPRTAM